MQRITPFLWFDTQAEQAATFYASIFKNSKITTVTRYQGEGPGPVGQVMTVGFRLDGLDFVALNGGPQFKISPAISFVVNCESQQELDEMWEKLLDGGKPVQCGWLTDRFGVSWQVVPTGLGALLSDEDPARTKRVMHALMPMVKIDIDALRRAHDGPGA
jgi:predicted 3-demethylubiquinone-9 3-methyltransferase (glyoxalase superfamily)